MTCEYEELTAHRYVAGTLSANEDEAFEAHLIGCADCQRTVRVGAGVRQVLRAGESRPLQARPRQARSRRAWLGAAVLAAAAALVLFIRRDGAVPLLGRLTPPPFAGAPIRGARDATAALVARGMKAYSDRDYRAAARDLSSAAERDASPSVAFYQGVSLLLANDPRGALAALRRAYEPAEGPYADDARLVAAKAWLRLRMADSALAELQRVSSVARARAESFSDSIRAARR